MVCDCAGEMSRRRCLLLWIFCLIIVLLIYVYLPYNYHRTPQHFRANPSDVISPILPEPLQDEYSTTAFEENTATTLPLPTTTQTTSLQMCAPIENLLVGQVYVNKTPPAMEEIIKELSVDYGGFVKKGGRYTPDDCIPKDKLAIVVPYRNRSEHLRVFLRQLHPIMERQRHDYRIIVVEQAEEHSFNRAMLLNIGFVEALKIASFDCFVFHDVDHILENDRNYYGCPDAPKLLGVAVERKQYERRHIMYYQYFGGVGAFSRDQFEKINGYSNIFWGWGGEDDDAYTRVVAAGYNLMRSPANIGRYIMLTKHHERAKPGPGRAYLLKTTVKRMFRDGLNTLHYKLIEKIEKPLYTHITVELPLESYVMSTTAPSTARIRTAKSPRTKLFN